MTNATPCRRVPRGAGSWDVTLASLSCYQGGVGGEGRHPPRLPRPSSGGTVGRLRPGASSHPPSSAQSAPASTWHHTDRNRLKIVFQNIGL